MILEILFIMMYALFSLMNMGQMYKDVRYAVEGQSNVYLINRPCGEWLSVEEIVSSVKNILEGSYASCV